jgi:hypothetical protein
VVGRPKNCQSVPRVGERFVIDGHPFGICPRSGDVIAGPHQGIPCQSVGPGFGRSSAPLEVLQFDACPFHRSYLHGSSRFVAVCRAMLRVRFGGRCCPTESIAGKPANIKRDLKLAIIVPALAYLSRRNVFAVAVHARDRHGRRL